MARNYVNYREYYKNTFLPEFEHAKDIFKQDFSTDKIKRTMCEEFIILFGVSFLLIKYYLHNNGLFQFRETDVIREAFNIELLDHGEEWMQICNLVNHIRENGFSEDMFQYFFAFEDLKDKFDRLV